MNGEHNPKYLVDFLKVNIDNTKLSDEEFRQVVRNTLPLYKGTLDDVDKSTE